MIVQASQSACHFSSYQLLEVARFGFEFGFELALPLIPRFSERDEGLPHGGGVHTGKVKQVVSSPLSWTCVVASS